MPRPIKDCNNFEINRSIVYNGKDINFHMPSMSACIKHYEIGFRYLAVIMYTQLMESGIFSEDMLEQCLLDYITRPFIPAMKRITAYLLNIHLI